MTNEKLSEERLVGEIVADDFRAAEVFRKAGIDFCCGGKKRLDEACREKNVDIAFLSGQLNNLKEIPGNYAQNFKEWDPGFLADYIVNTHHKYVLRTLPELQFYTKKIASVHGSNHPELNEVSAIFETLNNELLKHLQKEEEVLFPAIKEALSGNSGSAKDIIRSETDRMGEEHETAGEIMDRINEITSGYRIPDDACNTYRVALQLLQQFEDDLHIHVHLENNILYPRANSL
jgi:regulator of cell morphogenesis and NO signaling